MNYALFVEYEGILLGNTQKFSQLSLTRLREKTTAKQILRFIFEELFISRTRLYSLIQVKCGQPKS